MPAHRTWSLDSLFGGADESRTVPTWALWLVRAQVALVYIGGGVAKLNGDWLRGEPVAQWDQTMRRSAPSALRTRVT